MLSVYLKCCSSIGGFSNDFIDSNLSCKSFGNGKKRTFEFYKNNVIELNKNHLTNFLRLDYYESFQNHFYHFTNCRFGYFL